MIRHLLVRKEVFDVWKYHMGLQLVRTGSSDDACPFIEETLMLEKEIHRNGICTEEHLGLEKKTRRRGGGGRRRGETLRRG